MKRRIVSLLLCVALAASPVTAYADEVEVSDEELANEEAEAVEEEVVTDNRIIPNGISIGGTDVSGKTVTEAEDVVNNYFADYDSSVFTLSANGQTFTATGKDLCIGAKNPEVIEKAATYGSTGNFVERFKANKDLEEGRGKDFPLSLGADKTGIEFYLNGAASQVNDVASDDYLTRENGQFVFHEGKAGVVVQIPESATILENYIENEWDGSDTTVELATEVKEPRGSKEELAEIKDLLGSFSTDYSSSSKARKNNVANGVGFINGTILYRRFLRERYYSRDIRRWYLSGIYHTLWSSS